MGAPDTERKNLLLLSGGSKMAIARIAKEAAKSRGITLHISDTSDKIPTRFVADSFSVLPDSSQPSWGTELQRICQTLEIGLILPTRHDDLIPLSKLKGTLNSQGTKTSLSHFDTLSLCIHKLDTFQFFRSQDLPTPFTCRKSDYSEYQESLAFPCIAKPATGSASFGVLNIYDPIELKGVPDDWILQEMAHGAEYTTNLYLDQEGEPLCAIPHQRIHVENGEVTQAVTRRLPKLAELCLLAAQALPKAQGIINIQAFVDGDSIKLIEINPRIGGGYPLCNEAKGHYIEWLCQELLDRSPPKKFDAWTENLRMLRFRDAVFEL